MIPSRREWLPTPIFLPGEFQGQEATEQLSLHFHFSQWRRKCDSFALTCYSVQFSSVTQSCLTPCDPMECSTPGLPVHHQLPEFTQTHVHWVGDPIQPSHPLSSLSPQSYYLIFMNWPWFRIIVWELELILGMTSHKLLAENEES